jgi:UDP-N-acetylglucosamine--dolichyl-phosphate N-acetylglucosaminephosphotransferase
MGHMEIVAVVAIMPFIMNSFHSLASMGGLFERHDVKSRPIQVLSDGRLAVTTSKNAPLTLTRLLLVKGPLTEKQVVWDFFFLSIFSSGLALITLALIILTGGLM